VRNSRGNPKVDIEPIITRLLKFYSQRMLASLLGIDRTTIRRRTKVNFKIAYLAHTILLFEENPNISTRQLITEKIAFENSHRKKPLANWLENEQISRILDAVESGEFLKWFPACWSKPCTVQFDAGRSFDRQSFDT
jgi:hypothetical protein